MALVTIFDAGAKGLSKDIPPHMLDSDFLSSCRNIRFYDESMRSFTGHDDSIGTAQVVPYWVQGIQTATQEYYLYAGLDAIYSIDGATHADITGTTTPTGTATNKWTGGVLNGLVVLHNGKDTPQVWDPRSAASTACVDLANWDTFDGAGAGAVAKVLRPFGVFLLALDVTPNGGSRDPYRMVWSDPADPGSVPGSWDTTSAINRAGDKSFSQTADRLIDCAPLGRFNIVYKEHSCWLMTDIGGNNVFKFDPISQEHGLLAIDCAKSLPNGKAQFAVTQEDIVLVQPQGAESIATGRVRSILRTDLDTENYENSFVVTNPAFREVWFCYPQNGETWPNHAIVWNWEENNFYCRELPSITHATNGQISPEATVAWDSASGVWDDYVGVWDSEAGLASRKVVMASTQGDGKILVSDETLQFDGTDFVKSAQRTDIALVGQKRNGEPVVDPTMVKMLTEVFMQAEGDPFQMRVGYRNRLDVPVTWSAFKTFTPGEDFRLDFAVSGAYLSYEIRQIGQGTFKIVSMQWEIKNVGRYYP